MIPFACMELCRDVLRRLVPVKLVGKGTNVTVSPVSHLALTGIGTVTPGLVRAGRITQVKTARSI